MSDLSAPSSAQQAITKLSHVMVAARDTATARACFIGTRDREQAFALVLAAALAARVTLHHVTPAGLRRYDSNSLDWTRVEESDFTPEDMLAAAERHGGAVIFEEFASSIRDQSQHVKARLHLAELLARRNLGNGLVLALIEAPEAASHLPALLAPQVVHFYVAYPRAGELVALAGEVLADLAGRRGVAPDLGRIRAAAPRLAEGLVGLTRKAAEDSLNHALAAYPEDLEAAARTLAATKSERLGRELSMEILETDTVQVPTGMDNVAAFLDIQKPRMRVHGRGRARGILLIGPPGTGKTMFARAVGRRVGLPVVVFRIAALMNSLLGETERLFAQAFATLEAMAPVVVFIDEIEKAFGDSGERDGGTMMRVTGSLLSWLSDNPHPNFIIATCNNLSRMGEIGLTMTRSERFDGCYFVDVPAATARVQIVDDALRGIGLVAPDMAKAVAAMTDRFSGADLFSLVKQAHARAQYASAALDLAALTAEVGRKRARVNALYTQFAELRRWGSLYCEPASLDAECRQENLAA